MNPEALIGLALGKSVLQRLLGQGTMGAVYLASQTGRQVAVKVFLPAATLEQADQENFQKRLEEVITWGASLDHPSILHILEHGKQGGLIYQVTPYIAGESLATLLERSGALPFVQIQHYLEQLAAALDYAHTHGVLHRDIKPGNILITPSGDALLTDFGLAGLTTEKNFASARRPMPGMLNAIAPEYVLSKTVDQRADLYSLGVVLYHMVTGSPPFQGNSLTEVAMMHVKVAPPSPRSLRGDLPQAAEQVMLRALAKRPDDRYIHASELAAAFRLALEAAQPVKNQEPNALAVLADLASNTSPTTAARLAARRGGLFDPKWQALAQASTTREQQESSVATTFPPSLAAFTSGPTIPLEEQLTGPMALVNPLEVTGAESAGIQQVPFPEPSSSELAVSPTPTRTGLLNVANPRAETVNQAQAAEQSRATRQLDADGSLQVAKKEVSDTDELRLGSSQSAQETTGAFSRLASSEENTGAMKLAEPANMIQLPFVDQPAPAADFQPAAPPEQTAEAPRKRGHQRLKIASLVLAVLVILAGTGAFWVLRGQNSPTAPTVQVRATPNLSASATAQVTATALANIIVDDSLSQNTHNWPEGSQGWYTCEFKDGAYHITNNDKRRSAPALLPGKTVSEPFVYSLTMEQIKGDQTSPNNQFGMILDATIQIVNGKQIDKFYAFEVVNKANGQYQFWKYDNSKSGSPWTVLWTKNFGKEFSQGSGPSHVNTLKVIASGKMFTFVVNGKQVGNSKDSSFFTGSVGMLVNLNGAEVAFSNLLLTHS